MNSEIGSSEVQPVSRYRIEYIIVSRHMLRHDSDGELWVLREHQGTGQTYHTGTVKEAYQETRS